MSWSHQEETANPRHASNSRPSQPGVGAAKEPVALFHLNAWSVCPSDSASFRAALISILACSSRSLPKVVIAWPRFRAPVAPATKRHFANLHDGDATDPDLVHREATRREAAQSLCVGPLPLRTPPASLSSSLRVRALWRGACAIPDSPHEDTRGDCRTRDYCDPMALAALRSDSTSPESTM